MPTYSYWQSKLINSIGDMTERLHRIFDAERCRESWLQGELFLSHRERVDVNLIPIAGRRTKADLSADLKVESGHVVRSGLRPMVAELKVLAASFQRKMITGGAIKPFRRLPIVNGRRFLTESDARSLRDGPWGLVPDYLRLLDTEVPPRTEKLLVLAALTDVDERYDDLKPVHFEAKSFLERPLGKWGFVRIWRV
jgi:hypothetical protein